MSILTSHQKAALSFDHHISLTANAGSGKTFVLSKRYLEIALSFKKPNLKSIAAISFTERAASELYKKIANEIHNRITSSNNQRLIRKLENIRRQLVSANISTIHSFCIDILREFPVEAGLDANFTPIDEISSNELIELSVDELVKKSITKSADEEKLKYLVRILGSKSNLTNELIRLIKKRKNVLIVAEDIYDRNIDEISTHLFRSFTKEFKEIFNDKIPVFLESIKTINSEVITDNPDNEIAIKIDAELGKYKMNPDTNNIVNSLKNLCDLVFTKTGTVRVRGYLTKILSETYLKEINLLQDFNSLFKNIELPENHAEIETELARFGKNVIYFFEKAIKIYNGKKKENSYLDYEDILLFTKKILENNEVQDSLSRKYSFIMVDEYQDTNELQYNIFLPILDYLKKGNLFVVGDEKQSIYMFRDAELEVFNRTKNDIDKTSGENKLLTLPESFRMAPAISLFTNSLFSRLLSHPNYYFNEVMYNELICASNTATSGRIEILLAEKSEECEQSVTNVMNLNNEAEMVSKRICNLINTGTKNDKIKYSDIAILCRKRSEFKELENAFVKYKIPFVVVGGKGFYQRQSIYDIYNYYSFLLDKENDTALIGTLRSPFFNLSDSEIFEISLAEGKNYWEKLNKYSNGKENAKTTVKILDKNLKLSSSYGLTSLLRKILNETNYLAVIASRSNYLQELANVEKLIKVTTNFYSFGFKTLYDFVKYLKDSISRIEDEAQAVVSDESNSVKVMTYHQAKGLEFKAVFLFKSHQPIRKETIKAKKISINKQFGLLSKVPVDLNVSKEYQKAPIVGLADLIDAKKNSAEYKRLFYVGVTRAIEYLFISGTSNKDHLYDPDSIFRMLQSGLDIDFKKGEFSINSSLKFTTTLKNEYKTEERKVKTSIKIVNKIDNVISTEPEQKYLQKRGILLDKITDKPEGEFISATKVAVYKQCPLKYQLTYEFGFTKIFNKYKNWYRNSIIENKDVVNYEFNNKEELLANNIQLEENNTVGYSDIKGKIIHKILQEELDKSLVDIFVERKLKDEIDVFAFDTERVIKLKNEIYLLLDNYYNSETFKEISGLTNYENEFEIYVKENDYFLYGIIDKLIITSEKLYIVDYKTDDLDKDNLVERGNAYLPQLEFYSYIVNQLFIENKQIELKIVFLKYPEINFSKKIVKEDIKRIKLGLREMVNSIRKDSFPKNLKHCAKCLYALNNDQCIIQK